MADGRTPKYGVTTRRLRDTIEEIAQHGNRFLGLAHELGEVIVYQVTTPLDEITFYHYTPGPPNRRGSSKANRTAHGFNFNPRHVMGIRTVDDYEEGVVCQMNIYYAPTDDGAIA